MRIKIIALFLAIQTLSFGVWHFTSAQAQAGRESFQEVFTQKALSAAVVHDAPSYPSSSLHLSFSDRSMEDDQKSLNSIQQNQILTALSRLPQVHAEQVKNVTLDYNPSAGRGLGGNHLIIIRAVNMTTEEFIGVLVHEVGHNVDYGYLRGTSTAGETPFVDGREVVRMDDPSFQFYQLSWLDNETIKKGVSNLDFVSGYAMSDPFEDFGETYLYYVLHNRDFKVLATHSEVLYAKYQFMKEYVFSGVEFDSGDGVVAEKNRPWDTTVLAYDLDSFMN